MKSILSCLTFFFWFAITMFSQGEYLYYGQSGFGASAGFVTNYDYSTYQAGLGYSFNGTLDVGVYMHKASMGNIAGIQDMNEIGFAPYLQLHLLKQGGGVTPFSLVAQASIDLASLNSNDNLQGPVNGDHNSYVLGLSANRLIELNKNFGFLPSITGIYKASTMKINNPDQAFTTLQNHTALQLGFGFVFSSQMQQKFVVEPTLAFTDTGKQMGMTVALILPGKYVKPRRSVCYDW